MTNEEKAREMRRAMQERWPYIGNAAHRELLFDDVEAAIAAALTEARREALEEAAKVAEAEADDMWRKANRSDAHGMFCALAAKDSARRIADAIRAILSTLTPTGD